MSTVWQNTTGAREFSRRRVDVNGFCCRPPACPPARVVTLCRALFSGGERLRRQMTLGWRPLPCVERRRPPFFRAPLQPIGVCKSGRGVHCEKNGANRHPPACLQRKRRVAADDLAFSLLSFGCTSPPKTCRCKSGQPHRVHLANFFFANHLHYLSHLLLLLPGPLPRPLFRNRQTSLFCNRQKWPFRLVMFCVVITLCERQVSTHHHELRSLNKVSLFKF